MARGWFILSLYLVIPYWVLAQPIAGSQASAWLKQLVDAKQDSSRVDCLLNLAAYYQLKAGEYKSDIDSAFLLAGQAGALASSIGYKPGVENAALRVCQIRVEINDTVGVDDLFPQLSDSSKVKLLLEWGAHYIFLTSSANRNDIERFCRESQQISAASGNARIQCFNDELQALSNIVFDHVETGVGYARRSLAFFDADGDRYHANELRYRLRLFGAKIPADELADLCKTTPPTQAYHTHFARNMLIAAVVLCFILLLIFYNRYRLKNRKDSITY